MCVAMAAPLPAHAFEIFGLKLFGRDEPAEEDLVIGEPQNYDVEFSVSEIHLISAFFANFFNIF